MIQGVHPLRTYTAPLLSLGGAGLPVDPRDTVHFTAPQAAARRRREKQAEAAPPPPPARLLAEEPAAEEGRVDRVEAERWAALSLQAMRLRDIPALFELDRKLTGKELTGDDFQQAARVIHRYSTLAEDPLTSRIARLLLFTHFKWKDNFEDARLKVGPMAGAHHYLKTVAEGVDGTRQWFAPDFVGATLESLAKAARHEPPTPQVVRDLARTAHGFLARADMELEQNIRRHESPEQNRQWAGEAAELLADW
ncbi:MAG: hypothetical protein AB1758_23135, partial [Candidatus Eremiobacterota bacterium]